MSLRMHERPGAGAAMADGARGHTFLDRIAADGCEVRGMLVECFDTRRSAA